MLNLFGFDLELLVNAHLRSRHCLKTVHVGILDGFLTDGSAPPPE